MNPMLLHRFSSRFLQHRIECVCDKKRWLASLSNICCSILRILMQVSGTSSIRGRKNYYFSVILCISMYNCILRFSFFIFFSFSFILLLGGGPTYHNSYSKLFFSSKLLNIHLHLSSFYII